LFVVGGRSRSRSRSRWCRPDKPGLSRGHVSTAVTGAEMEVEVERAWDDRTYVGLPVVVVVDVLGKGDFPRAG
jgi:hypothetical protein